VKCSCRWCRRFSRSAVSMDRINRLMNQVSEYWYMGSMLARSAMEKNKMVEWTAMGVYPIHALSILISVSSVMACFSEISLDKTLDDDRTLMAVSSSRMLASDVDRTSRILPSISCSCLKVEGLDRIGLNFTAQKQYLKVVGSRTDISKLKFR
jgi:hypothetical protein